MLAESPFGFGLKAGVPLNDALSVTPNNVVDYVENTQPLHHCRSLRWNFRLPAGFGVED